MSLLSILKGVKDALPFIATIGNSVKPKEDGVVSKPLIGIIKRIDYARLIGHIATVVVIFVFVLKTKDFSVEYLKVILEFIKSMFF